MAILEIPTFHDEPYYEMQTILDGSTFILTFHWNEIDAAWFVSVADSKGVAIWSGRRIVANWPLMARCRDARRPKGEILCVVPAGDGSTPRYEDLGDAAKLMYLDAAELGRT